MTELDFRKTPKLTHIGEAAFGYNGLLININFSESSALRFIGTEAFKNAKLTNLDLSGATNLTFIGYRAFNSLPCKAWSYPLRFSLLVTVHLRNI